MAARARARGARRARPRVYPPEKSRGATVLVPSFGIEALNASFPSPFSNRRRAICFTDGPVTEGVCCPHAHYTCADCFDAHVRNEAGKDLALLAKCDGRICGPRNTAANTDADRCDAPHFPDKDIAAAVSNDTFEAYLDARSKLRERQVAEEMEAQMERDDYSWKRAKRAVGERGEAPRRQGARHRTHPDAGVPSVQAGVRRLRRVLRLEVQSMRGCFLRVLPGGLRQRRASTRGDVPRGPGVRQGGQETEGRGQAGEHARDGVRHEGRFRRGAETSPVQVPRAYLEKFDAEGQRD